VNESTTGVSMYATKGQSVVDDGPAPTTGVDEREALIEERSFRMYILAGGDWDCQKERRRAWMGVNVLHNTFPPPAGIGIWPTMDSAV
jgi:hypothetical protein